MVAQLLGLHLLSSLLLLFRERSLCLACLNNDDTKFVTAGY